MTLSGLLAICCLLFSTAHGLIEPAPAPTPTALTPSTITLSQIGRFQGQGDGGGEAGAEISAYDPVSKQLFVTNAANYRLDVLDLSNPASVMSAGMIDLNTFLNGGGVNSVAVHAASRLLAVALEANVPQDPGSIAIFHLNGSGLPTHLKTVAAGALPDMVTFTPDGKYIVAANEGEPNDAYTVDPVGSITIIPMQDPYTPQTAGFASFNGSVDPAVRIFGIKNGNMPSTVEEDLEPEYIAISPDSMTAYVTLQENNALAIVDIASATVTNVIPLGFKNHGVTGNELDPSNRDDGIRIATWGDGKLFGMYQPDAIASFQVDGKTFLATANEGDARDYSGFSEEERIEGITLDATAFPNAATLQMEAQLGRLQITTTLGDAGGDGDFDELYAYGARSFSILDADTGARVWDSGSQFAFITAQFGLPLFNANDSRSDDKGSEPEGIVVGVVQSRIYAFIGLERTGGIMVYEVSDPFAPKFVQYVPNSGGDVSPEGLTFVSASESPLPGIPLLIVTHEVSSTTTVFRIDSV